MIEKDNELSIRHQCKLLGLHRSGLCYATINRGAENLEIMRLLDEQYEDTVLRIPKGQGLAGDIGVTVWARNVLRD
ncbi:MAG: hypothetical protein IPG99_06275 [Ignavibacteria bacterium]|nr:hypothetical protein [Ignavibacteria bacterium]